MDDGPRALRLSRAHAALKRGPGPNPLRRRRGRTSIAGVTASSGASHALRVLVVSEDASLRLRVERTLSARGDRVARAESMQHALDWQQPVDAVLIDLGAGQQGSGLALAHFLRARDPTLAILVVTPEGDVESGSIARSLGADGWIPRPLTGDGLLLALDPVREKRSRREGEGSSSEGEGTAWLGSVLEAPDLWSLAVRTAEAAQQIVGGATKVLIDDERQELTAQVGTGADGATERVALRAREETLGALWVQPGSLEDPSRKRQVELLSQVSGALGTLLRRVDAVSRIGIKDPDTSAYTFSYFVDVAGREIERARRHERRFGLMVFRVVNYAELREVLPAAQLRDSLRELVDSLLDSLRDGDVLARVEDDEFYLLAPETGRLGCLAHRRRLMERQQRRTELGRMEGRAVLLVSLGVATFPRDGRDLSSLLQAAQQRSEPSRSLVHRALGADAHGGLEAMLGALLRFRAEEDRWQVRQGAMESAALRAIGAQVTREALRGNGPNDGVVYVVGDREQPLVEGVLAVASVTNSEVPSWWLRSRGAVRGESSPTLRLRPVELEVDAARVGPFSLLIALTEGWAYACVASEHGNYKRVMHTSDLELVEALVAEVQRAFHLQRGMV